MAKLTGKVAVVTGASKGIGAGIAEEDDPALAPDAGLITWRRGLVLEYVAQEPVLDPEHTVAQALAREEAADHEIATIRALMSRYVGVVRDGAGLQMAVSRLCPLARVSDMALVALLG